MKLIVDKIFWGYTWYTFHNKTQQKIIDIYISHQLSPRTKLSLFLDIRLFTSSRPILIIWVPQKLNMFSIFWKACKVKVNSTHFN